MLFLIVVLSWRFALEFFYEVINNGNLFEKVSEGKSFLASIQNLLILLEYSY